LHPLRIVEYLKELLGVDLVSAMAACAPLSVASDESIWAECMAMKTTGANRAEPSAL